MKKLAKSCSQMTTVIRFFLWSSSSETWMLYRTFLKDPPHLLAAPRGRTGGDITTHERTAMKRSSAPCGEMTEWALSEELLLIPDKGLLIKSLNLSALRKLPAQILHSISNLI